MAHITFIRRLLIQSAPLLTLAQAQQVNSAASASEPMPAVSQDAATPKRDLAVARARETLKAAGIDPTLLSLTRAEPITWPNSSLGCAQPGVSYLQVTTPGYLVEFKGTQESYSVHVAANHAIVCTGKTGTGSRLSRPIVPLRGIDVMTDRARQMLAAAVHAPADQIRVVGFVPQVWPDTGLGCPTPDQSVPGRVTGFRIELEHLGRAYSFNTDLHRVIACPAISTE